MISAKLGDYRNRATAHKVLQDAQIKLGRTTDAGRPAIIKKGANGLARYSVLLAGLSQSSAQRACRLLADSNVYCVSLSPRIIRTRYASAR